MDANDLQVKVQTCIGKLFCKIKDLKCVGRDTTDLELKMKKLHIALWLVWNCDSDLQEGVCLVNKICP